MPADATQLRQVFQNLIGNALKYHSPDRAPDVHVAARRSGREWLFSVADNGIGIGTEFHEKVFAMFQRLHGSDSYPGTGIGPALCRKIVERHGGRIWGESEPGKGATFLFTCRRKRSKVAFPWQRRGDQWPTHRAASSRSCWSRTIRRTPA